MMRDRYQDSDFIGQEISSERVTQPQKGTGIFNCFFELQKRNMRLREGSDSPQVAQQGEVRAGI